MMLINLGKQKLTPGQLNDGNINEFITDDEKKVIKVISNWQDNTQLYNLTTSGSTGNPKEIQLSQSKLGYSAQSSLAFLDPDRLFRSSLLCINPDFIGGLMVIIRSLIAELELTVISPSSKFNRLPEHHVYDLTSMVPMQLQHLLDHQPDKLQQFRTILVGGAPLPSSYIDRLPAHPHLTVYQTYGMTETASHIALRNLSANQAGYATLGDVQLDVDERQCLRLRGSITEQTWLQTNDVVNITSPGTFTWLGRADFVINSGGIKIHPEILEQALSSQIKFPFFVAGMEDSRLGEKAVLLIESEQKLSLDLTNIEKYKRPKAIYYLRKFSYTDSNKINRKKTLELIKDT